MMAEPAAALGIPLRLLAEADGVSAAQVIPDSIVGDYRDLEMLRKVTSGAQVVTFDHEHVPTEHLHALAGRRRGDATRARGARARPGQGGDASAGWPSSGCRARATRSSRPPRRSRRSACRACSRRRGAGTTAGASGSSRRSRTAPRRSRPPRQAGVQILAEERVDFRRELSALVARSPSGQAAAYPVVASTQLDGICHEVVAPAPGPVARAGDAGPAGRADDRQGARRDRRPGGRAVRDQRRPDPGQRAGDAAAQHRPLDPGRRGHQPVREPPARGARPAARLAGAARDRGR